MPGGDLGRISPVQLHGHIVDRDFVRVWIVLYPTGGDIRCISDSCERLGVCFLFPSFAFCTFTLVFISYFHFISHYYPVALHTCHTISPVVFLYISTFCHFPD